MGYRGMDKFLTHITAILLILLLSIFKLQVIELSNKKLKFNSFPYQIRELVYSMVYIQKKKPK